MTGTRLGSYELLFQLASGGMATVHVARRVGAGGFQRVVAIKRVHAHVASDATFRSMFVDEARLSSQIHHANVVAVTDVVDHDGELFLVLDYVESVSLATLLRRASETGARIPLSVAVRIGVDMLAGLDAAHEATDETGRPLAIVHRDVSPQNVIVGTDGTTRLLDFGIAKAAQRFTDTTQQGSFKGKLRYMSPEQARNKPIDKRSDVFAAGAVLYETITGEPAIAGESEPALLLSLLTAGDEERTMGPDVPPGVERAIAKAMEVDVTGRYASALEFRRDLEAACAAATSEDVSRIVFALAGDEIEARRARLRAAGARKSDAGSTGSMGSAVGSGTARRRAWYGAGAAAVVVGVATAGALVAHARHHAGSLEDAGVVEQAPVAPAAATTTSDDVDAAAETVAALAPESSASTPIDAGRTVRRGPSRARDLHKSPYRK